MTHILLCRLNFLTFFTIFLCFNFSRKTGNRYFLFFTAGRLKSNNELERVLREKKKRELEIRNAHKEQERVEKERLKLEKKVKKAEKTANRKEMGILRKNLRGKNTITTMKDEFAEEQLEMDIGTTLEAYDHLVH